jgi:acetyl-CoA acetyltransferase
MNYAIVGLGVSEVGRVGGHAVIEYEAEAARRAVADAELEPAQIGAALQALSDPGGNIRTRHDDSYARVLGLPVNVYVENVGRGGEYAAMAIVFGMKLLDLGVANYVLVSGARDDWTRSRQVKESGGAGTGQLHHKKEGVWGYMNGAVSAVSFHSLLAARHMAEFGTTEAQLGAVAVAQRDWAHRNPEATMQTKSLDIDTYLGEPYLVRPYRKSDCSLQSDGGVAFVMTTADRAREARRAVFVNGVGFGEQLGDLWWKKRNYTTLAVERAKELALSQARASLDDIAFAQLYDCFTGEVIAQLEDYGWCGKGSGGAFAESDGIGPKGAIPVNTGGGLLSSYHLGNLTGIAEAVRQLRGEAGQRQVNEASLGLVSGHGGEIVSGQLCSIHSTIVLGVENRTEG